MAVHLYALWKKRKVPCSYAAYTHATDTLAVSQMGGLRAITPPAKASAMRINHCQAFGPAIAITPSQGNV